jgi:hypothetical protein
VSTYFAGVEGFRPEVREGSGNPEALKYGKLWADHPAYRAVAPGEELASVFLKQASPPINAEVIDFGCGTGRGSLILACPPPLGGSLRVTMVDFVNNCLDPEVQQALETQASRMRFLKKDLEKPLGIAATYGYCTDVMEHIPPDKVEQVLDNILQSAEHVFFGISLTEDHCGKMIGEQLHLTVKPFDWWLEQFTKREAVVHWSKQMEDYALFYVTAWSDGKKIVKDGTLNETMEQIKANVKANCEAGWDQAQPYEANDMEIMILGGGWSLPQYLEEIKRKRAEGVKLVTLNGTYNWALEHGLDPSATIIVDSRPFNARFTKPVHSTCRYLIASQCHPSVLEGLPKDRTLLWHTMYDDIKDILKDHYTVTYPVPSCTTVLNTSIPLLRMLGFKKFHLYGCDSCLAPDRVTHHAYDQPENNSDWIVPITVNPGNRLYWGHPWMAAQGQQFMEMLKLMKDEVEIEVYGEGLLKGILEAGASLDVGDVPAKDIPII